MSVYWPRCAGEDTSQARRRRAATAQQTEFSYKTSKAWSATRSPYKSSQILRKLRATLSDMTIHNEAPARRSFGYGGVRTARSVSPKSRTTASLPLLLPRATPSSTNGTMQAIRLQKKYPEVSQEEMFELINRFK